MFLLGALGCQARGTSPASLKPHLHNPAPSLQMTTPPPPEVLQQGALRRLPLSARLRESAESLEGGGGGGHDAALGAPRLRARSGTAGTGPGPSRDGLGWAGLGWAELGRGDPGRRGFPRPPGHGEGGREGGGAAPPAAVGAGNGAAPGCAPLPPPRLGFQKFRCDFSRRGAILSGFIAGCRGFARCRGGAMPSKVTPGGEAGRAPRWRWWSLCQGFSYKVLICHICCQTRSIHRA